MSLFVITVFVLGFSIVFLLGAEILENYKTEDPYLQWLLSRKSKLVYLILLNIIMFFYYWGSLYDKELIIKSGLLKDTADSENLFKYASHIMFSTFATGPGIQEFLRITPLMRFIFGVHQFLNFAIPIGVGVTIIKVYDTHFKEIKDLLKNKDEGGGSFTPPTNEGSGSSKKIKEDNDRRLSSEKLIDIIREITNDSHDKNEIKILLKMKMWLDEYVYDLTKNPTVINELRYILENLVSNDEGGRLHRQHISHDLIYILKKKINHLKQTIDSKENLQVTLFIFALGEFFNFYEGTNYSDHDNGKRWF